MDTTEKIVGLIRLKGPVIPSQLHKELNSTILITSATLGELVSKNVLKLSNLKIGGTPLYFLEGQEAKLQQFSNKLKGPEKTVYDLIRQKVVLRDKSLTPVTRVALRQIKDFAKPLQVNNKGNIELFWKWYLTSNQEAEKFIKKILGVPKPKEIPKKIEKQERLKPITKKPKIRKPIKEDEFLNRINNYFGLNKVEIIEQKVIRKNSDIEFVVKVPSAVGSLTYFCKAKSKKKVNDGDLSSAYMQGQGKQLPVLFLTLGILTKKAQLMLEKEFKGMSVKKV